MKFIECNRANNIKIYVQDSFSILNRSIEISMKEIILRENIIFQAHSILAGGLLSGKYEVHNGDYAGEGRLSNLKHQTRKLRDKEILRNYEKLKAFAKRITFKNKPSCIVCYVKPIRSRNYFRGCEY